MLSSWAGSHARTKFEFHGLSEVSGLNKREVLVEKNISDAKGSCKLMVYILYLNPDDMIWQADIFARTCAMKGCKLWETTLGNTKLKLLLTKAFYCELTNQEHLLNDGISQKIMILLWKS